MNKPQKVMKKQFNQIFVLPLLFQLRQLFIFQLKRLNSHNLSQYDEAINSYEQAIQIDPRNSSAYFNMGNCLSVKQKLQFYKNLKKDHQAIKCYEKTVQLNPNNSMAYQIWVILY